MSINILRAGHAGCVEWIGDATQILLDELTIPGIHQADIASTYALAITGSTTTVDWGRVNRAIMNKWSEHGLERIKEMAWRKIRQVEAQP